MPSIAKTGIDTVDKMFEHKDINSLLNISLKNINLKGQKKEVSKTKFFKYINSKYEYIQKITL